MRRPNCICSHRIAWTFRRRAPVNSAISKKIPEQFILFRQCVPKCWHFVRLQESIATLFVELLNLFRRVAAAIADTVGLVVECLQQRHDSISGRVAGIAPEFGMQRLHLRTAD